MSNTHSGVRGQVLAPDQTYKINRDLSVTALPRLPVAQAVAPEPRPAPAPVFVMPPEPKPDAKATAEAIKASWRAAAANVFIETKPEAVTAKAQPEANNTTTATTSWKAAVARLNKMQG